MQSLKRGCLPLTIIVVLGILIISRIAYIEGYRLDVTKDSAPAWVQAIGSIFAIVVAAFLARQQNVHSRNLEEYKQAKADKQKLEVIMALMARSHRLAMDVSKAYQSQKQEDIEEISPPLMEDTHLVLSKLPVFEIPEWQLSLDVLMLSRALATLREQFLSLKDSASQEELNHRLTDLNSLATEIQKISEDSLAICKKEIKEREQIVQKLIHF